MAISFYRNKYFKVLSLLMDRLEQLIQVISFTFCRMWHIYRC